MFMWFWTIFSLGAPESIANDGTQLPTRSANQEQTLLINYKFSIARELRNRNIIRVCVENLSIAI